MIRLTEMDSTTLTTGKIELLEDDSPDISGPRLVDGNPVSKLIPDGILSYPVISHNFGPFRASAHRSLK